jgi:peptidyl-prolyl cis-trans isomerase C
MACGLAASGLVPRAVAQKPVGRTVVARIGGEEILQSELDAVLGRIETLFPPAAPEGLDATTTVMPAGDERQLQIRATALEQLVDERLIRAEIERAAIAIGQDEIRAGVELLRSQLAARGTDWATFLARSGRDERSLREQVMLELGMRRLIAPLVDQARLERAFASQRRRLDGTRLRISHIVLRADIGRGDEAVAEALAKADAIRREVLAAELTFDDAARRYSAGPSRLRGGDLGWISVEGPMFEDFTTAAYAVAKGDVSKPFVTRFGVHLVKVIDLEPGRLGIEEVRDRLIPIAGREALQEMLNRLRAATPVEYSPGVAHFDRPRGPAGEGPNRQVVVEGGAADPGSPGAPRE